MDIAGVDVRPGTAAQLAGLLSRAGHAELAMRLGLAVDMNMVRMPILKPMTYEELAHTRDSLDYILKMYLTLVMEGGARHGAKLIDVSSAIAAA